MDGATAARISHLNQVIAACDAQAERLFAEQERVALQRSRAIADRDALLVAARVTTAREPTPAPPPPPPRPRPEPTAPEPEPARPEPPPPRDARPETSVLSVQNLLLVLGGVLLGVAAITFSVVAWTAYGHSGQSLILAAGTAVALAVPILLARRGLAATAETIGAVALLLVALDGFTIWALALFGIHRIFNGYAYAGLVFALTCAVAVGYRRLTGLTVAWYVAVLAAQPVLPLLAIGVTGGRSSGPDTEFVLRDLPTHTLPLCGAAVLALAVAAQNLVVASRAFGRVLHAVALGVAWLIAATALVGAPDPASAALATATLVPCGALTIAVTRHTRWRDAATALSTVVAVGAAARVAAEMSLDITLVALAGALLAAAVVSRLLPDRWRTGPRLASTVMTTVLAAGTALASLGRAVLAIAGISLNSWWLPATVVLVAAAAAVLLPQEKRHHAVVAGIAVAAVVIPPWPAVAVGVGLGLSALLGNARETAALGGARNAAVRAAAGAALGVCAVGIALPSAGDTAVVLAVALAACLALGMRGPIASAARAGALAILPALVWSVLVVAGLGAEPRYAVVSAVAALSLTAGRPAVAIGILPTATAAIVGAPTPADAGITAALIASAVLFAFGPRTRIHGYAVTTVALVAALARLSAVAIPGTGFLVAAGLTSVVGIAAARRTAGLSWGALVSGGAVVLVGGGVAVGEGVAAVVAAMVPAPWRADLTRWPELASSTVALGHQVPFALALLCAGCGALPERFRIRAAVLVGALAVLSAPAAFGLPWWVPAALSGTAAVVIGAIALSAPDAPTSRDGAIVAGVLGPHAIMASAGRPGSMAILLAGTVLACAYAGILGHVAPLGPHHRRLAGWAIGGGLAAVPGCAASLAATAGLSTATVVAIALTTASVALAAGSLVRLARGDEAPAIGAAAGAALTGVVIWSAGVVPPAEHAAIGVLLFAAALRLIPRRPVRDLAGAGGATLALIASGSRLAAVLVPGVALLTTSAVVLLAALGVSRLPQAWRRAPAGAVALAVVVVGAVGGGLAIAHGLWVVAAGLPPWHGALASVPGFGFQPVPALVLLAGAALALATTGWGGEYARDAASVALGLAIVEAPVALGSPWWVPATVAVGAAIAVTAVATIAAPRMAARLAVAGAVLGGYASVASLYRPVLTLAILGAIAVGGAVISTVDRHRWVGGGGLAAALAVLPGATVAATATLGLGPGVALRSALAACVIAALLARRIRPGYVSYAVAAIAVGATAVVLATVPFDEPTRLYAALAALIAIGAVRPRPLAQVAAAAGIPLAIALACVTPAVITVLFAPYAWLLVAQDRSALDVVSGWDPVVLALLAAAAAWLGRLPLIAVGAALAVVVAPVAWDLPGQSAPAAACGVAVVAGLYAARHISPTATVLCGLCGGAGLAGALRTDPTTYAALGLAAAAGLTAALIGRSPASRITGWLVAGAGALGLLLVAPLPAALTAAGSAMLAALFLGAAAIRPAGERVTVEVLSFVAVAHAVLTPAGLRVTAAVLVGYGAVLGLSALRPGRTWLAPVAATCEVLAWWLLLFAADVRTVEAYTLPVTLVALLAGALQLRRRPHLSSWLAYGPALAATFLPSLALLFAGQDHPTRRLLLFVGAVCVLVLGARHRRQAPVACGAGVVLMLAAYELIRYWDTLPRWAPMGAGGLVLVVLGATYERRLRDMRRLRAAVAQMQ